MIVSPMLPELIGYLVTAAAVAFTLGIILSGVRR